MSNEAFIKNLKTHLSDLYLPPRGQGGHDLQHVVRMEKMYSELTALIPGVNEEEYVVSVWLHNIDRCPTYSNAIKSKGLKTVLGDLINPARFPEEVKRKILRAVLEHGKRDDGKDDSALLSMLRLADKWDRIGMLGATSCFAWKGSILPAYDHEQPFGYGDTSENGWKTHYQNFYRILEWYQAFPLIRELVRRHPWKLENFLFFVRGFAREVAEAHGVANTVEADIEKCLGAYYDECR